MLVFRSFFFADSVVEVPPFLLSLVGSEVSLCILRSRFLGAGRLNKNSTTLSYLPRPRVVS